MKNKENFDLDSNVLDCETLFSYCWRRVARSALAQLFIDTSIITDERKPYSTITIFAIHILVSLKRPHTVIYVDVVRMSIL